MQAPTNFIDAIVHTSLNITALDYRQIDDLKAAIPGLRVGERLEKVSWASFEMTNDEVGLIQKYCKLAQNIGVEKISTSVKIKHRHKMLLARAGERPHIHGSIINYERGERNQFTHNGPAFPWMAVANFDEIAHPSRIGNRALVATRALEGKDISLEFKRSVQVTEFSMVDLIEKIQGRFSPLVLHKGVTYSVIVDRDGIFRDLRVSPQSEGHSAIGGSFIRGNAPGLNDLRKDFFALASGFKAIFEESEVEEEAPEVLDPNEQPLETAAEA